jgi:hypothetical protein
MIQFAKFNKITEVWMNCIEGNKVIQHLAHKNQLTTKYRGDGERTAALRIPQVNSSKMIADNHQS